jgi:hypothetical protein
VKPAAPILQSKRKGVTKSKNLLSRHIIIQFLENVKKNISFYLMCVCTFRLASETVEQE